MPDALLGLATGFSAALALDNLLFCLLGVVIGTLVGVLPGIGPLGGMALLLPLTYHVTPMQGIIMLAGIFYGTQYGGSTTSILMNMPGEIGSVVTCLDGHQMALKGRAGAALGISAFGSFAGGTLSVAALMLIAPPLATAAMAFGPPEYFTLLLLGVFLTTSLGGGPKLKSLMMAFLGLFLGTIGIDMMTADERFVFGSLTLMDGIGIAPVAMGLFGVAEILSNLTKATPSDKPQIVQAHVKDLLPTAQEWRRSGMPIARGAVLGFLLGILPGGGAIMSSFASYALEKKLSKYPQQFGHGAIEGVAGPETANNAATGGALIPLLTLGVPATGAMAVLMAAFLIHGLQPGPLLMAKNPELFWGIIASMYIGNVILLALNLPLIGVWVQVLKIPGAVLFPLILLFAIIGCYSVSSNVYEVVLMVVFGLMGYVLRKFDFNPTPAVFGLILSPLIENAFRQSLAMNEGLQIFVTRPIACAFLVFLVLAIAWPVLTPAQWRHKAPELP